MKDTSMPSLLELRNSLDGPSEAYRAKQVHQVPEAPTVDRAVFVLSRCKGKVVLDIGASGEMHNVIALVTSKCYGIDRETGPGITVIDLDSLMPNPPGHMDLRHWCFPGVEVIVCGEVIEHLSNPGNFLNWLRRSWPGVPVIVTVPNAFCSINQRAMRKGHENCNIDHVAWYSPRTIKTLLGRAGYTIKEFAWYGKGESGFTEGLICVAE